MIRIINESFNPYFNLALEEYLLKEFSLVSDLFVFWQNRPAVIVGRNQNTADEIDQKFVLKNGHKGAIDKTTPQARKFFKALCRKTGLPYIMPHGLRHTHATFLLRHGHSVNAVAERLGDDPKTIMKTYAHVLPSMQKEMVMTIAQLYE